MGNQSQLNKAIRRVPAEIKNALKEAGDHEYKLGTKHILLYSNGKLIGSLGRRTSEDFLTIRATKNIVSTIRKTAREI